MLRMASGSGLFGPCSDPYPPIPYPTTLKEKACGSRVSSVLNNCSLDDAFMRGGRGGCGGLTRLGSLRHVCSCALNASAQAAMANLAVVCVWRYAVA